MIEDAEKKGLITPGKVSHRTSHGNENKTVTCSFDRNSDNCSARNQSHLHMIYN
jgi:hypothetical protein